MQKYQKAASTLVLTIIGVLLFGTQPRQSLAQTNTEIQEEQAGDPSAPATKLTIESSAAKAIDASLSASRGKRVPRPKLALETLNVARQHIGVSRKRDRAMVASYLDLYGLPFQYSAGNYVPFCASGVGFAACQAYRQLTYGNNPSASDPRQENAALIFRDSLGDVQRDYTCTHPAVAVMVAYAQKHKTWRLPIQKGARVYPKKAWLVVYNWKGGAHPQHIGIVDAAIPGQLLSTVEFNTSDGNPSNGGTVAAKKRDYKYVLGYIDTYAEPIP